MDQKVIGAAPAPKAEAPVELFSYDGIHSKDGRRTWDGFSSANQRISDP